MATTIEERIERLLDQLENSALAQAEIDKIQKKIDYLRTLES